MQNLSKNAKIEFKFKTKQGKKMNSIKIIGRLTKDAEFVRKDGKIIIKGCIASNTQFKQEGKVCQETIFLNFVIKDKLAQFASEHKSQFVKSAIMLLYGSLSQGRYTDNKGTKSTYTQVVVGSIYFVKQETLSDEMLAKLDKINEKVKTQDDKNKQLEMEELKMCDDFESELDIFYDLIWGLNFLLEFWALKAVNFSLFGIF